METILFRGRVPKDFNENFFREEFVEGSLILCEDEIESTIINSDFEAQVLTDSVGQFVCLDKNKNKVWSNSKVKYFGKIYALKYLTNGWYIDNVSYPLFEEKDIDVVAD